MERKTSILCQICCLFLASSSSADTPPTFTLIHTEELGGVYTQDWYTQRLASRNTRDVHLYIVGDGKSGDFHGVLSVDCDTPTFSRWLSTGGVVPSDSLPVEAIKAAREFACM